MHRLHHILVSLRYIWPLNISPGFPKCEQWISLVPFDKAYLSKCQAHGGGQHSSPVPSATVHRCRQLPVARLYGWVGFCPRGLQKAGVMPGNLLPNATASGFPLKSQGTKKCPVVQCVSAAMNNAQMALLDELHNPNCATPKPTYTLTEGQSTLQPTHKRLNISLSHGFALNWNN